MVAVISLIAWGFAFVVAFKIGEKKDRRGWLYALLGGWIGVLILACISPVTEPALVEKERRIRELELDARIAALDPPRLTEKA